MEEYVNIDSHHIPLKRYFGWFSTTNRILWTDQDFATILNAFAEWFVTLLYNVCGWQGVKYVCPIGNGKYSKVTL